MSQGDEKFLTIGNFAPFSLSGSGEVNGLVGDIEGAYYFIDDVLVQCLDCGENQPAQLLDTVPSLAKGTTMILENIFFETNKSQLLQQSYNELQRLIQLLNSNPSMRVAIIGHTDNQGKKAYNQQLSERRAQSVVEYLQSHGIKSSRLKYMGMGDSQPIDSNDTAEGRARNRRVALEVL